MNTQRRNNSKIQVLLPAQPMLTRAGWAVWFLLIRLFFGVIAPVKLTQKRLETDHFDGFDWNTSWLADLHLNNIREGPD
jgi:hypothetical protein